MLIKLPLALLLDELSIVPGDPELWCYDPNDSKLAVLDYGDMFRGSDNYLETLIPTYQQSELQTYLRNHKILVEAVPVDSWDNWTYSIYVEDCFAPFAKVAPEDISLEFPTYEDALEAGLTQAIDFL